MRALPILLVLLLAACGAVRDRAECSVSTDCPAGQYCARTPDGSVCWPDAVPPSVSAVTVSCPAPCLRDSVLHVQATVSDDAEVLGAEVTLDVGGPAFAMTRAAGVWQADVELRRVPFEHFSHGVVASVTARDGARNVATMDASPATTVTRLRFERALDAGIFSLGPPAVMEDGTVVTAGTNGKVYFVPWDGLGVASTVAVGAGQITAAPLALGESIWIGSEDNRVYEVTSSGLGWEATQRANTGGPVKGSLAVMQSGHVIAASESGVLYAITSVDWKNGSVGAAFSVGPVVDEGEGIFAVAAGSARRFNLVLGIPTDSWASPVALGGTVSDPLACTTAVISAANTGTAGLIRKVGAVPDPEHIATTGLPSSGVALLADGSIIAPEQTKTVSRWTSTGAAFPGWQKPDLGGATRTPLVLTSSTPFVVSTAKGAIHSLKPDGSIAWSGQLSAGTASLQPGNLYTPPGQLSDVLSTAYFAGSDGVLHAVIVDGALDAAAPWPKAFHDPRNTNRAGAQP